MLHNRRSPSEVGATAAGVVALIGAQSAWMGRAVVGLDVGLIVAFAFWSRRGPVVPRARRHISSLFLVGIGVQALHFAEELATGFQKTLPAFFGYAWSDARFAAFNLFWLAAFAAAALGLRRGWSAAALLVWFFALAGGIGNGVLHVAMGVARRGYFPGLLTAPFLFVIGVALLRRLLAATAADSFAGSAGHRRSSPQHRA